MGNNILIALTNKKVTVFMRATKLSVFLLQTEVLLER